MLDKVLKIIEQSKMLESFDKANRKLGPLHPMMLLLVVWHFFSKDARILMIWEVFVTIFSFSFSFLLAKDKLKNTSESLLIAFVTVLIFIFRNSTYLLIYSSLTSLALSNLFLMFKKLRLNFKNVPQAVNHTLSNEMQLLLFASLSFIGVIFLKVNFSFIPLFTHLILKGLSSMIGILIVVFFVIYLWSHGYHGVNVMNKVLRLFYLEMLHFNISQYFAGTHQYYYGTETFYQWGIWIGGSGATLGLAFALRFLSKDKQLKSIGKSALTPALFNINEEIIFGIPIVRNKKYIIPFYLTPILCASVSYIAILKGYVSYPLLPVSWVLPLPLGIFISTLFDLRAVILALVLVLISFLVYLPFLLKDDREKILMSKN